MNLAKCPKCNADLNVDSKFCHSCGYKLTNDTSNKPFFHEEKRYKKASIGLRFAAYIIDSVIKLILAIPSITFIIIFILSIIHYNEYHEFGIERLNKLSFLLTGLILLILPLIYEFLKDGLGRGQSIGKRAVGIMVVSLNDNKPCTFGKSVLRALIWMVLNMIPLFGWIVEPILVLSTDDGRRIGDRAADTMVIEVSDYKE